MPPQIESINLTKENLNNEAFLLVIANILESINALMVDKEPTLEELTKLLSQTTEAKAFYEQVKASSVNNYVSEANELLTNLHSTIETTINEIKDNYNTDLTQLKETLLSSVQLSEEKTESINTILSDLQTKKEELEIAFSNLENFKGQKGDQGIQGDKGDQGVQGLQGDKGDQGVQGDKGLDGVVTFESLSSEQVEILRGQQGIQGVQGDKGDQGIQGIQGDKGLQGEKGDQGLQGARGNDGTNGNDGQNGVNGQDGKSNYDLAKDNGFIGTVEEYLSSLKGTNDYTLLADFPVPKISGDITLSEDFSNFHTILILCSYSNNKWNQFISFPVELLILNDLDYGTSLVTDFYITFEFLNTNTIKIAQNASGNLKQVYGVGRK